MRNLCKYKFFDCCCEVLLIEKEWILKEGIVFLILNVKIDEVFYFLKFLVNFLFFVKILNVYFYWLNIKFFCNMDYLIGLYDFLCFFCKNCNLILCWCISNRKVMKVWVFFLYLFVILKNFGEFVYFKFLR